MKKLFLYILTGLTLTACTGNTSTNVESVESMESVENVENVETPTDSFTGNYKSTGDASLLNVALPAGTDNTTVNYDYMTVYFNTRHRIPNCVVYELTNTQVSMANAPDAEKRENYEFNKDEKVKSCPDWWEYKGTGYDRGHMAPAMDMRWNKTAMRQCFYMTNMCPQRHELNDGEWRHMEEAIHNWGRKNDRLVIFTGPVLGTNMAKTGKNQNISVPEKFFKVVYAPLSKRAIAFVMENRDLEKSWTNYATTIDEVERLTGIDFLASLPDDLEQSIESKQNIKQWPQYIPRR